MMQRLRDQIKSRISIGSAGVKDKELLVEAQKSILTNNDSLGEHAAAASSESFLGGATRDFMHRENVPNKIWMTC
jgi:hypothetical protein